ncbi:MAG TPA: tRNA uridine-5-carboxymethylaminomethyl(34) synthesis GTPase MnmE [Caldithrix abyssi]|uniref:tRNA modification GTPase MnmE n=1 Tax=Caldithrix abyssi TaxID=187145 RepID=A0A7V5RQE6_CALAY|nr:tRNA uridine-5-carboxymethylaminomethyl(34) synthesis GTPase MnmE [Caldithrix abyssi]
MDNSDIIIAPISATQGGSVNLIRLSGNGVIELVNDFFSREIISSEGGRFYYGQLNKKNETIDDVIVYVFRTPHSYTGEDVIEISCHGNFFITEEIISLFLDRGCRLAEPGEFSKRAFLNSKIDLIQAEAVADIIASRSRRAVKNSLKQLHGSLSVKINELKKELINLASLVELEIDFSEEDIEIIPYDKIVLQLQKVLDEVEKLIDSYESSKSVSDLVQVLLLGKPNVGKSSIMNTFINRERVIVSSTPGTTRDHIHEDIIIDDTFVRLIDSAGIRDKAESIEKEGVSRAKGLVGESDLVLFIFDGSRPLDEEDITIINLVKNFNPDLITVVNKTDIKLHKETISRIQDYFPDTPMVKISATRKTNIDILKKEIARKINTLSDQHTNIVTNIRHYNLLKKAREQTEHALKSTKAKTGPEFLSIDFRSLIDTLGAFTGAVTTDEILNNIFSKFCIGK